MNVIKENKKMCTNESQNEKHKSAKSNSNKMQSSINWTNEDKGILLQALKTYGPENIEAISKMLPNIPCQEIKSKIHQYSKAAEYVYGDEPLNNWLNCGLYKPGDSLIPQALLFIELFENHPSLCESEGYDFRAIYNFLYRSCSEETSHCNLSAKDRDLLCFLLSRIEEKLWPRCQADIVEYIGRVYNKRNIKKVYHGKRGYFF